MCENFGIPPTLQAGRWDGASDKNQYIIISGDKRTGDGIPILQSRLCKTNARLVSNHAISEGQVK